MTVFNSFVDSRPLRPDGRGPYESVSVDPGV